MVRGLSILGLAAWLGLWVTGTQAKEKDLVDMREGNGRTWEIDYYYTAEMCAIYFETRDGGFCKTRVTCKDGGTIAYHSFPNLDSGSCFVGGRTTYNDPRIGEFTIIYTKRDGTEGQGLTNPYIVIKNMEPAEPIDVTALAKEHFDAGVCFDQLHAPDCDPGPFVCHWILQTTAGVQSYTNNRLKRWHCGVPRDGKTWPRGMTWERLRPGSGWKPTWFMNDRKCLIHPNCRNWRKNPPLVKVPDV